MALQQSSNVCLFLQKKEEKTLSCCSLVPIPTLPLCRLYDLVEVHLNARPDKFKSMTLTPIKQLEGCSYVDRETCRRKRMLRMHKVLTISCRCCTTSKSNWFTATVSRRKWLRTRIAVVIVTVLLSNIWFLVQQSLSLKRECSLSPIKYHDMTVFRSVIQCLRVMLWECGNMMNRPVC